MAKKARLKYKGQEISPSTEGRCVMMESGKNVEDAIKELKNKVIFEGELENGSQYVDSFLNYDMIELLCVTTAGEVAPSPFSVRFSVQELYEKEFCVSHVNGVGHLCSAKLVYSGSGGSLSVSENKAVDLSSETTLPVSSGIRIYKIIGYKA